MDAAIVECLSATLFRCACLGLIWSSSVGAFDVRSSALCVVICVGVVLVVDEAFVVPARAVGPKDSFLLYALA